jgi:hypothetical protein
LKIVVIEGKLKGISIIPSYTISHFFFVDDILIFYEGNLKYVEHLEDLLSIVCKATRICIDKEKYSLFTLGLSDQENFEISQKLSL